MLAMVFWRFLFDFYGRVDIRSWILRVWSKTQVAVNDAFLVLRFVSKQNFLSFPPIHYFVSLLQLPQAFSCLLWFRFMSPSFFTCWGFTWCPGCWVTRWWGCFHFHWRAKLQGWYTESCPLSESCSRNRFFCVFLPNFMFFGFPRDNPFKFW